MTEVLLVEPVERRPGEPALMGLRVPVKSGNILRLDLPYTIGIDTMLRSEPTLRRGGAAIPKFYRSSPGEYIALEFIPHDFTLHTFLKKPGTVSPEVLAEAEVALKEFARATARLGYIDDFHAGQLVYDKRQRKWTLLDWMGGWKMPLLHARERNHIFGDHFLSIHLHQKIDWEPWSKNSEWLTGWEGHVLDMLHREIEAERRRNMPLKRCLDKFIRTVTANPAK